MLVTVISQHRVVASAPPHHWRGWGTGSLRSVVAGVDPGRARVPTGQTDIRPAAIAEKKSCQKDDASCT